MNNTKELLQIAKSLLKYMQGTHTEKEKTEVESWLKNPSNRDFFNTFRKQPAGVLLQKQEIDLSKARQALYHEMKIKRLLIQRKRIWLAAASVIILTGVGSLLIFLNPANRLTEAEQYIANFEQFPPGSNKALLTLGNGKTLVLDSLQSGIIAKQENTKIIKLNDGQLVYNDTASSSLNLQHQINTLYTPRGGEYQLTLPDGTKVWLNAETTLKYPVSFNGDTRSVSLNGEAYFEVAPNKQKPFIVNINDKAEVKVLGTHFNINAYENEETIKTTLIEGSVQVSTLGQIQSPVSQTLSPGEQAAITNEGSLSVQPVETYRYIAWKEGYFAYKEATLDEILKQLSRWYQFKYQFENNKVKEILFTARLKRYEAVGQVFRIIEQTGQVKFTIKDDKVIVSENK